MNKRDKWVYFYEIVGVITCFFITTNIILSWLGVLWIYCVKKCGIVCNYIQKIWGWGNVVFFGFWWCCWENLAYVYIGRCQGFFSIFLRTHPLRDPSETLWNPYGCNVSEHLRRRIVLCRATHHVVAPQKNKKRTKKTLKKAWQWPTKSVSLIMWW